MAAGDLGFLASFLATAFLGEVGFLAGFLAAGLGAVLVLDSATALALVGVLGDVFAGVFAGALAAALTGDLAVAVFVFLAGAALAGFLAGAAFSTGAFLTAGAAGASFAILTGPEGPLGCTNTLSLTPFLIAALMRESMALSVPTFCAR